MKITDERIEIYVEEHSQDEPEILRKLNDETREKLRNARMISGHYQGRLLSILSKLIRPKNILEIGTFTGYSAICMAEGMQTDGVLHTIDTNEELYELQREYFDASGYGNQIVQHLGDAKEILPDLEISFDLVFIDADKKSYQNYVELILPKMKTGGVILSDNVLWRGKVAEEEGVKVDSHTKTLRAFNTFMKNHPDLESIVLPIRDGLTLSRVK